MIEILSRHLLLLCCIPSQRVVVSSLYEALEQHSLTVQREIHIDHNLESNSGFTHDGAGANALIHAPNLCSNASISVLPTMTISAAAVKVQVQPEDACQEDMKNCII